MPVYNAAGTLGTLLTALQAQLPPALGPAEYLFVDNGSTDRSRKLLANHAALRLQVLDEARRGASAARNRGLKAAGGQVVVTIDADCVPVRTWLRQIAAPFADPDVKLVAGGLASYPPRTAAQRFAARYGLNDASRNLEMAGIPFANGRNLAVRREVAVAVGGWPEDMDRAEDIEFSYRVRQRFGCPIEYRPLALAFHQDRASDEELQQQAFGYGRGMALLYARHAEFLPWGMIQRALRARMSIRRTLAASFRRMAHRVGRADAESVEFADYLAMWDRWFWRGFDHERQSPGRAG